MSKRTSVLTFASHKVRNALQGGLNLSLGNALLWGNFMLPGYLLPGQASVALLLAFPDTYTPPLSECMWTYPSLLALMFLYFVSLIVAFAEVQTSDEQRPSLLSSLCGSWRKLKSAYLDSTLINLYPVCCPVIAFPLTKTCLTRL